LAGSSGAERGTPTSARLGARSPGGRPGAAAFGRRASCEASRRRRFRCAWSLSDCRRERLPAAGVVGVRRSIGDVYCGCYDYLRSCRSIQAWAGVMLPAAPALQLHRTPRHESGALLLVLLVPVKRASGHVIRILQKYELSRSYRSLGTGTLKHRSIPPLLRRAAVAGRKISNRRPASRRSLASSARHRPSCHSRLLPRRRLVVMQALC